MNQGVTCGGDPISLGNISGTSQTELLEEHGSGAAAALLKHNISVEERLSESTVDSPMSSFSNEVFMVDPGGGGGADNTFLPRKTRRLKV